VVKAVISESGVTHPTVNTQAPDILIYCEIVKSVCAIGIVPNPEFLRMKKFNVHLFTNNDREKKEAECAVIDKNEEDRQEKTQ